MASKPQSMGLISTSTPNQTVRLATVDELEIVNLGIDRFLESLSLERGCYPSPWSEQLLRGEFEKELSFRPAIILDQQLIAQSFNYIVADELHILNLAVTESQRGRGYGRILLSQILSLARQRDVSFATLEVRRSNQPALELYKSFAFKITGLRPNYYKNNNEDALILELML